jgi:hypothetical protein
VKRKLATLGVSAALVMGLGAATLPASAVETVTINCSNGFTITVAARATRGAMRALTQFNKYNQSGVTCTLEGAETP